jgi:hypothetical protein
MPDLEVNEHPFRGGMIQYGVGVLKDLFVQLDRVRLLNATRSYIFLHALTQILWILLEPKTRNRDGEVDAFLPKIDTRVGSLKVDTQAI